MAIESEQRAAIGPEDCLHGPCCGAQHQLTSLCDEEEKSLHSCGMFTVEGLMEVCRYAPACERLVDMAGLKTLFAIFMGRSRLKGQRKTDASTQRAEEERVVSVICNLLSVSMYLGHPPPRSAPPGPLPAGPSTFPTRPCKGPPGLMIQNDFSLPIP